MDLGIKQHFPDRTATIIILFASLLVPVQLIANVLLTPNGLVYAFGTDEMVQAATANSYIWNFKNPYGPLEGNVFQNPVLGSVYLQTTFGFLSYATTINPVFFIHLFSLIFSIFYYIVIYKIISLYFKNNLERNITLLFFIILSGGVGGILYSISTGAGLLEASKSIHFLNSGGLTASMLVYHIASAFFATMALYMILSKKHGMMKPLLFLGLSALVYPLFSLVFLLIILVFFAMNRNAKCFILSIFTEIIFLIPLTLPAILPGGLYSQYLRKADYINLFVFLELGIFLLVFSAYFIKRHAYQQKNLYTNFIILWMIAFVVLTIMPPVPPLQPQRLLPLVWMPLSIVAAMGFFSLLRDERKIRIGALLLIALTIPTLILWYSNGFSQSSEQYLTSAEMNALKFLGSQPEGRLLSAPYIGLRAPVFAKKRSLMSGVEAFDIAMGDYEKFFTESATSEQTKTGILNKYNIRYILTDKQISIRGFAEIYSNDEIVVFGRE